MTSNRGAENLARFNAERSAGIEPMLVHELQLCRKRKLSFSSVGLLAAYLAERLKVHRTTLLRNPTYSTRLFAHLAGQPGVVASAPDSTQDPAILQAKLATTKLELGKLREALHQHTKLIEKAKEGSETSFAAANSVNHSNVSMILATVISRFPDFLCIDFDKRELHDLSARPSQRIVAGPERMAAFCTWIEQNQSHPLLASLKTSTR